MNEAYLVKKIQTELKKKFGPNVWFYKSNDRFQRGIPDLIVCLYGRFLAFEVKDPNRKRESLSRPMQLFNIQEINKAGGTSCFVENVDDVLSAIRSAKIIIEIENK